MHMYNMSLAKLKTSDNYINNTLAKRWICKFQSLASTSILFILKKSSELHLYINYYKLNVIIIKNYYSLLLASELLDQLNSSVIFSKINLQNIYYRIQIREVYLDNILIFSKIEEEHYQYLELVIKHLWYAKLYINFKKCKFFKIELKYLDFLVNKKSLCMNSSYVKIISKWCSYLSKIYQDIQIFIEFCNFYWHFIYNFASIAQSLH